MPALLHDAEILIVDDESANLVLLKKILIGAGYKRIHATTEPRKVALFLSEQKVDIILLDLQMPLMDGFAVMEQIKNHVPKGDFLPVLVLTADITAQTKLRALSSGAHDFLTKPFDHAEVVQRVGNLLRTRALQQQVREQNENLERLVIARTAELEATLERLREAQQRIVQQERLHAFGAMASGVAHDFNNNLTTILGFGEIALRACEGKAATRDIHNHLKTIITAAHDGARMVTRLREFYRPVDKAEPRVAVDLNDLVEQAVMLTQPKWKAQALRAGVRNEVAIHRGSPPPVSGDAAELREMLTNLIFNAVDAMPNGGRIDVRTCECDGEAVIEVSDTGTGMTEEVRRRCLEPFFSTKGDGGTGLGLAMVYGIVERHGGSLEIESAPGCGTKFVIGLPLGEKTSNASGAEKASETIDRPLHVLVVDDQPVLCTLLSEYLKNDCHTVVAVGSGQEALQRFAHEDFDLIITDHAMPGMTGEELAAAIKATFPTMPIILLTGFGEVSDASSEEVVDLVLAKPVSLIEFRHALVLATASEKHSRRAEEIKQATLGPIPSVAAPVERDPIPKAV